MPLKVLVEEKRGDYFVGYDQFYNKIFIKSDSNILKEWVMIDRYETREDANYA